LVNERPLDGCSLGVSGSPRAEKGRNRAAGSGIDNALAMTIAAANSSMVTRKMPTANVRDSFVPISLVPIST
jgi:hypothetical protein